MGACRAQIARLLEPRKLVFEEIALEEVPEDGIVARTLVTAISTGTEVAAWSGLPPLRPTANPYPRLVGYMNIAEVTDTGVRVTDIVPGTLVYTHQSHRSGFVLPQNDVLAVLPPGMSASAAAPAYLYRLALSALRRGGFNTGMRVAVIGLGAIGLAAVELAASLGGEVAALSGRPAARDKALALGAGSAGPVSGTAFGEIWKEGADLVITTSNRWADWQTALELAGHNSNIAVLGFPGRGQPTPGFNPLDSALFYDKQLSLIAAGMGLEPGEQQAAEPARLREDMSQIISWIAGDTLRPDELVHAVRPWNELADIYCELEADAPPGVVMLGWA